MTETKDAHVKIDRSLYDQVMKGVTPEKSRGHLSNVIHNALVEHLARKTIGRRGTSEEIDAEITTHLMLVVGADLLMDKLTVEGHSLWDYMDEVRAKYPIKVEEWCNSVFPGVFEGFDRASLEEYRKLHTP